MTYLLVGSASRLFIIAVLILSAGCGKSGSGAGDAGDGAGVDSGVDSGRDDTGDSGYDPDSGSEVDTGPVEGNAPVISDLFIESNPRSVLSCFVNWTTDVPADSEVQFGAGAYVYRVRRAFGTTRHRVLVIGLRADTTYQIKGISETTGGADNAETQWTTSSLPTIVPIPELTAHDPAASTGGWTLTNVSAGVRPFPPVVTVMYDEEGQPVWYYVYGDDPDDRGDIDVRLLDSGNVLIGPTSTLPPVEVDLAGNVVWEGPSPIGTGTPMTHHFDKLDNGNYLTLREVPFEDESLYGTMVEEFTPEFDIIWQWNILDHVAVEDDTVLDWCHGNSVTIHREADAMYMSCRNLKMVFKASLWDGRLLWQLGADGDFDIEPPRSSAWFGQLHDPEFQPNGNVLIYDNGDITRGAAASDVRSRVVEYALDESTMTATLVWEFPGDFEGLDPWYTEGWFTLIWGDADRLENGNTLITAGTRSPGDQSRIFEVTAEGRVVWEIRLPLKDGAGLGVYRAQRIPVPPLIERL